MKLSVVMTYHNRPQQLWLTLQSIWVKPRPSDMEIIIVDDGSDETLRAENVVGDFPSLDIQVIYLTPQSKWWVNPSIPYNIGISQASGEIIVLQNPECLHKGNILQTISANVRPGQYHTFSCYHTMKEDHQKFHQLLVRGCPANSFDAKVEQLILPLRQDQWFNHPEFLPTNYHFCSAMYRGDMDKVGRFNEAFGAGYCFDDNEFLWKIKKEKLQIVSLAPVNGYVVHQWHPKNPEVYGGCPAWEKNRKLYNLIIERGYR